MRRRSAWLVVVATTAVSVVGLGALGPASSAGPGNKTFHVSLAVTDPGAGPVGGSPWHLQAHHSYTFDFTLSNPKSSPQAFGSAKFTPPSGLAFDTTTTPFVVNSDVYGNFTPTLGPGGAYLLLTSSGPTGSGVQPGGTPITVEATVDTADSACPPDWLVQAKQSNDFSGVGNDFTTTDSIATYIGNDKLVWTTQPSTSEWDVAMSPAPVITPETACGTTIPDAAAAISVSDASGQLKSTGLSVVADTAVLRNVTFNDYGLTSDTLIAHASGFDDSTSDPFDVVQVLVTCADPTASCSTGQVADKGKTTVTSITADPDQHPGTTPDAITVTVKGDPSNATCERTSGETAVGQLVTFNVTDRSKTVIMLLTKDYVNSLPDNGKPHMDICLGASSVPFTDKFGNLNVTDGLLPDCSVVPSPNPCIVSRSKNAGNEIITFTLPPGDPHGSFL